MNNKKIKKLLAVFFLVDVVLLCVYGYLFFVITDKNKETAALYLTSHQQSSDKEKIQGLARMLKESENDRKKLSEYFVTKTNAVAFIEQIEKIGKDVGVGLTVNSVSDAAKDKGSIELSFSATGSFPDMYRLIALVESMPYKVTLKKMDMQRAGDLKEGISWKGNFAVVLDGFVSANSATTSAEVLDTKGKK